MISPTQLSQKVREESAQLQLKAENKIDAELANRAKHEGMDGAKASIQINEQLPRFVAEELMQKYRSHGWQAEIRTEQDQRDGGGSYLEVSYRKPVSVPSFQQEYGALYYDR